MWKVDEETSSFSAKDLQRESVKLSTTCKKKHKIPNNYRPAKNNYICNKISKTGEKKIKLAMNNHRPAKNNQTCTKYQCPAKS